MKVGIVTIIGNDNYGNRLQNYALQTKLKKLNTDVLTLPNEPFSNTKKGYIFRIIKNIKNKGTYSENKKRRDNFKKFNEKISFSKNKINAFTRYKKYDYLIVGSDQVWNPNFSRLRDVDLLANVESSKRIAYAASFGVNEIPDKYNEKVSIELAKFKKISVREQAGKKIVENLTYRNDIEVLIDPTMLITEKEWDKVIVKPSMITNKKFILNYFLGNLSDERKYEIERIAKENECCVINILDEKSPFYECGPSEFLYLEKNAFLICTDSFHSSVFAVLFNRPFIVFDREQENMENMSSRLDTLINKFALKDRKFEGKITEKNIRHDYTEAYKILEEERKKANAFLKESLDIKESDINE